jgi:hypothetical protein
MMVKKSGSRFPWLRDRDGNQDPVLTFALLAMVTVIFKVLFAGATLKVGNWLNFSISPIDAATIGALFLPTLGAYVSNRYVAYNYHPDYLKMRRENNNGANVTTAGPALAAPASGSAP